MLASTARFIGRPKYHPVFRLFSQAVSCDGQIDRMLTVTDNENISRRPSMSSGGDQSPPDDSGSRRSSRVLKNDLILHEAVIKNDAAAVEEVLREEAIDINSRNNYGRAPIHWAASKGNTDIMKMLITAKCDIEAKDKYGMRPLLMAAWHGNKEAIKMLVDAGGNVNAVNKKQYNVVMCAARNNRLEIVNYLLEHLASVDLEAVDYEGHTCLHQAALEGHHQIVDRLLILGVNPNTTNQRGRTPLHSACEKGHELVVERLLKCENIQLQAKDFQGNTPMHLVVENRFTQLAYTLLQAGASADDENIKGMSPLHLASCLGCRGITTALLEYGADVNKRNREGNSPLHLACEVNDVDTIDILISSGCHLNSLNSISQSPMHIAAEFGFTDVCKMLLAAGASTNQRELEGRTPLHIAARGSFTAIVDMIIKTARLEYSDQMSSKDRSESCSSNHQPQLQEIIRKLAYQHLRPDVWKELATHWDFTEDQIKAIEHQHEGPQSFRDHSYRMLAIWAEGLDSTENPLKELYDALIAVDQKKLADYVKKKMKNQKKPLADDKNCRCSLS